jgi:polyferredoxin
MTMTHPGLPLQWALLVIAALVLLPLWALLTSAPMHYQQRRWSLAQLPLLGLMVQGMARNPGLLLVLKLIFVGLFLLIIYAGLWGTPIPERNLATTLTWNLWWSGIVLAVFFSGSAWCAVCPWDTIASWLVKHRLWRRSKSGSRLQLKVPRVLRSVWPATVLFVGFSWLELGVGVTTSPVETARLALLMVVLATLALALFEGKAFCRYMCPVGRTIGAYSQLSPLALRPIEQSTCDTCETLECYHGSDTIDACPTHLVMGRLQESTYCISCGNCTQSCPVQNISWSLRSPSVEALQDARPHTDEAVFMLTLLALTSFHGLTMLPAWATGMSRLGQLLGDSGQLLLSFSIGLLCAILVPLALYAALVLLASRVARLNFTKMFSGFAFAAIPLAFSYHMAHNLNHLIREASDWGSLLANPTGAGTAPLSMMEKHARAQSMLLPGDLVTLLQALLLVAGLWLAVLVVRHRGQRLFGLAGWQLLPMLLFCVAITGLNLWLLAQPMVMRM